MGFGRADSREGTGASRELVELRRQDLEDSLKPPSYAPSIPETSVQVNE